ncbi:MAG: hypothetical protein QOE58_350 [Actinomycetota bacterium]|jgi:hypothetical protein|nr:hypothetical protein [Actinomycetota bacterium]
MVLGRPAGIGMTSWSDVERADPQFAGTVRSTFAVRKHATMATTQPDGTPRISGTEVEFADDGEIYLGMMAGALRAMDLRLDSRLSIHCPTEDPPEGDPASWIGDGKITANAVDVSDPANPPDPSDPAGPSGAHRFRLDILQVVLTKVGPGGDHLEITSWRPGRGLKRQRRT